nr:reverse transcriptase domain-containing protein [Tanacetum cinerariifolium]
LFDDSTSSDDESSHEEVIHEMIFKTYSNPLFDLDEKIISSEFNLIHNEDHDTTPKNDRFDTESYLLESLLNHDALMASFLKIDSLLAEFAGELIFLKSIPPGIDEANCDPKEDIHLVERLLYDNSSPRPPEEFVFENSNAEIKSFSPSPIPVEDSDSHMEEIDLSFTPDDPMPPGIEDDDHDSERDILIFEELLDNYSLSLPENESIHFDIPSFSHPPAKTPDGNTGILNIKMMGDISKQKVPMPGLTITRVSNQEKSPDLLSHRGLEIFQPSAKCPMMIHGKNIPILDALKDANFDLKTSGDHKKVQLNELNELCDQAYENSLIYKEKTKRLHDSKIKDRVFNINDRVLLFNSRLKIFSDKLNSYWSGPFTISHVYSYGTVELSQPDRPNFKVNGHHLKHYFREDVPKLVVPDLQTFPRDY